MLTGPSSEVMRCPGQVVGHVQPILSRLVIGIVEDGEQQEFDGREGGIVVPEKERGGWIDDINLNTNRRNERSYIVQGIQYFKMDTEVLCLPFDVDAGSTSYHKYTCVLVRCSASWDERDIRA